MRQENLLFFFLFFAEGGEVKVRLLAKRRRRSRVSWPFGGGRSSGL
jgi:hypothetical protein